MNKITKSKNDKTSGVMKQLRILNVASVTSSRIFKEQETEGVLSHLLIIMNDILNKFLLSGNKFVLNALKITLFD